MSLTLRIKKAGFGLLYLVLGVMGGAWSGPPSEGVLEEMPLFVAVLALVFGLLGLALILLLAARFVTQLPWSHWL